MDNKFEFTVVEKHIAKYYVKASSLKEAHDKFLHGSARYIDDSGEFVEIDKVSGIDGITAITFPNGTEIYDGDEVKRLLTDEF